MHSRGRPAAVNDGDEECSAGMPTRHGCGPLGHRARLLVVKESCP